MTRLLSDQAKNERWQASTVDHLPCLAAGPPYSDCRLLSHFLCVTQCSSASCLVPAGELLSFAITLHAAVHATAGMRYLEVVIKRQMSVQRHDNLPLLQSIRT